VATGLALPWSGWRVEEKRKLRASPDLERWTGAAARCCWTGAGVVRWSDVAEAARPALIDSMGSFVLRSLTVRHAAESALRLQGEGEVELRGVKLVAWDSGTTPRIEVAWSGLRVHVQDSTFSGPQDELALAANVQVRLQRDSFHALSEPLVRNHAAGQCVAETAPVRICGPATLPLYVGDVFYRAPQPATFHKYAMKAN
jgi:hypothetical protein